MLFWFVCCFFLSKYLVTVLLLIWFSIYPLGDLSSENRVVANFKVKKHKYILKITKIWRRKAVCNILHWISCGHRAQGPKLQSLFFLSLSLFWAAVKALNRIHGTTVGIPWFVFPVSLSALSEATCANPCGFCDIFLPGHACSHWYQTDCSRSSTSL